MPGALVYVLGKEPGNRLAQSESRAQTSSYKASRILCLTPKTGLIPA
jgi:hypothetical protein